MGIALNLYLYIALHYFFLAQLDVRNRDSHGGFLVLRIVFALLFFLVFQINLISALSKSMKNFVGIWMGIALNL